MSRWIAPTATQRRAADVEIKAIGRSGAEDRERRRSCTVRNVIMSVVCPLESGYLRARNDINTHPVVELRISMTGRLRYGFALLLATVGLDAIGIGLVMPLLPRLLQDVSHTADLYWGFGTFLAIYALMQFLCAPALGVISDRYGRRPVLLASLAGATIDYVVMALAPNLLWLFIGRALAGVSGANMAVAQAYVADITPGVYRARRFGLLGAFFGMGFIAGPILGCILGVSWLRAPFLAAGALNGLNFLMVLFILPESGSARGQSINWSGLNPFISLRWATTLPELLPLMLVFVSLSVSGQIGGTIWVLYCRNKFAWNSAAIGISLAGFGLFHAVAQACAAGPLIRRYGERRAITIGVAADAFAYLALALATRGWVAFILLPVFCLGGIVQPALQSLFSNRVAESSQGHLQGILTSLTSLSSLIGPFFIAQIYFASRNHFAGFVWVLGAGLSIICLPAVFAFVPRYISAEA